MSIRNRILGLLLALAVCSPAAAQGIVVPNTFTNGTTADADQVNANFAALVNNALNRTGGIMSGSLQTIDVLPVTTDVSDIGTNLKKYRDGWFSRNVSVGGTFTATGAATLGNGLSVTGPIGATGLLSIATSGAFGTMLAVGGGPTRQLHVYGAGQAVRDLTDAGAIQGTIYIQDSAGVAGNGGALLFGASQGHFAALKAGITDGAGATVGTLSIVSRTSIANANLTEVLRVSPLGTVGIGTSAIALGDLGMGALSYAGAEAVTGVLSVAIGADQNNYNPVGISNAKVLRVSPTGAPRAITGIAAMSGHVLIIMNGAAIGSGLNLVLGNLTTSAATNQFAIRGGANITLEPGTSATAYYDPTSTIWSVH